MVILVYDITLLTFAVLPPPVQHQRSSAVPLTRVLDQAVARSIHVSCTDFCVINFNYESQCNSWKCHEKPVSYHLRTVKIFQHSNPAR